MTVLAAMPSANVTIAVAVNAKFFVRTRRVNFRSRPSASAHPDVSIVLQPPGATPAHGRTVPFKTTDRGVRNARALKVPDRSHHPVDAVHEYALRIACC